MKKLIFKITLPLTLLLFNIVSMWQYGAVIDGTDEFLFGFPFIHKCRGFHTSLATQYFITEMFLNFICYFTICLLITYFLSKNQKINISNTVAKVFWIGFMIFFISFMYISQSLNDVYVLQRDFEVEIFDRGFSIFGGHPDRELFINMLDQWIKNQNQ